MKMKTGNRLLKALLAVLAVSGLSLGLAKTALPVTPAESLTLVSEAEPDLEPDDYFP